MKRKQWLIDGIKNSKKVHKKEWNRKIRKSYRMSIMNNCSYKRIADVEMYDRVT